MLQVLSESGREFYVSVIMSPYGHTPSAIVINTSSSGDAYYHQWFFIIGSGDCGGFGTNPLPGAMRLIN